MCLQCTGMQFQCCTFRVLNTACEFGRQAEIDVGMAGKQAS